jgi:DNA-binding MarR family transcriptional regulator
VGDDQRSVEVCLTPAGRALTEKVAPLAMAHERAALAGFDEDEARTLKALLRRVAENVEGQENASTRYDAPAPHFAS